MTKSAIARVAAMAMVVGASVITLRASDPVGCYTIVERVVLEPNSTEPTAIQVWGAFVLSTAGSGNTYRDAEKGYVYFTCPKGRDAACLNEWFDLKALAGKNEVIGFGYRYGKTTMRVRPASEKPAAPDEYPLNIGLVKMGLYAGAAYPAIDQALRAALQRK